MAEEYDVVEREDSDSTGINQKLDYPYLLLYQMQKISQSFSSGNITGGIYLIRIMESSCSFKDDDGWKKEIAALDAEFKPAFDRIKAEKGSSFETIRSKGAQEEQSVLMEYWLRRFDIIMSLRKMKNMLYKETVIGEIR